MTAPNGTVIFKRASGVSFTAQTIFAIFCPTSTCIKSKTIDYYVTLHDSWADTWEGTILAFRQNSVTQTFNLSIDGL